MCVISFLNLVFFRELLIVVLLPLLSPALLALLTLTVPISALVNAEAFAAVLAKLLSLKEVCNVLV